MSPSTFERSFGNGPVDVREDNAPTGLAREAWATKVLMRASEILASSLDLQTTLNNIARQVVPQMADAYALDLLDDAGHLERASARLEELGNEDATRQLVEMVPWHEMPEHPIHDVLQTGVPFFADGRDGPIVERLTYRPERLDLLRTMDIASIIIVPLEARGRMLGAMSMLTTSHRRRFDRKDLAVAAELARRAAMAVDNARLLASTNRAREEAQRANRAKSDFLATMSHELRTPLNAIAGYTQLLLLGLRGELTETQRDDLERIAQSQRHLLGLINSVLNFAKLDAGSIPYYMTDLSVNDVLNSVEPMISPQMRAKGIQYAYVPCDPAFRIHADEEKLRQIMLNLLSNAIKFTPRRGTVTVRCDTGEAALHIRVRDTGVGIDPSKLDRIFEPFMQVDRTLSTIHEGVGLGLAISRDLARGMGGNITVLSEVHRGTTFSLTFPRV